MLEGVKYISVHTSTSIVILHAQGQQIQMIVLSLVQYYHCTLTLLYTNQ